jgi:uncharacterized OB-fold protein
MSFPTPQINDENRAFWTGGAEGELRIARCGNCGFYLHPPTPRCPECWSDDIAPSAVSGRGRVYTYTINRQQWMPGLEVPFVLAVIELDEQPGLRLVTTLVDCAPEDVEIGLPAEVTFVARGEAFIPLFRPVS